MKDRLRKIIEYEQISYTKFADEIDIQRSGVSHLLSGRNNPSLEVIQKILRRYDYIDPEWLLLGKGTMIKDEKKEIQGNLFSESLITELDDKPAETPNTIEEKSEADEKLVENNTVSKKFEKNIPEASEALNIKDKKITKIVIFYSDKTFSDFVPE